MLVELDAALTPGPSPWEEEGRSLWGRGVPGTEVPDYYRTSLRDWVVRSPAVRPLIRGRLPTRGLLGEIDLGDGLGSYRDVEVLGLFHAGERRIQLAQHSAGECVK